MNKPPCAKGDHFYASNGLCMKCDRESYKSRKRARRVHAMLRDMDAADPAREVKPDGEGQ